MTTLTEHAKTCGGCWRCDIGQPSDLLPGHDLDPFAISGDHETTPVEPLPPRFGYPFREPRADIGGEL